jgi:hypothetical protein
LHLTEDEYLDLTPGQLYALIEAYNDQQRIEDFRVGSQLSLLANIYRDTAKHSAPFTLYDFGLPFLTSKEVTKKGRAAQEYEEAMRVKAMNKVMGGKEIIDG